MGLRQGGIKDAKVVQHAQISVIRHISKMKGRNLMIISIDAEMEFEKIQPPYMIKKKALNRLGVEGTYLTIIKAIYGKPTVNIRLNVEKLKGFPLRSETRQVVNTFTTFCSIRNPSQSK